MNDVTKTEKTNISKELQEKFRLAVLANDLRSLSPIEKTVFVQQFCESVGLNWVTRPLDILANKANGKEALYLNKDGCAQLRKLHKVSVEIKEREFVGDDLIVYARAHLDGRFDEALGVVNLKGKWGQDRANLIMKCETVAKNRVTKSICGIGLLTEDEVDTVPDFQKQPNPALTTKIATIKHAALPETTARPSEIIATSPKVETAAEDTTKEVTTKINAAINDLKRIEAEDAAIKAADMIEVPTVMAKREIEHHSSDSLSYRRMREEGAQSTEKQRGLIKKLCSDLGWNNQTASDWLKQSFGVATREELQKDQASAAITLLKEAKDSELNYQRPNNDFLREIESL